MKKRILTLLLTFNLLGLFTGCFLDCPDEKYFDYSAIGITVDDPEVGITERFKFGIKHEDLTYLASNPTIFSFQNSAYATSVCKEGYGGEKYRLIRVSIKSNNDFNAQLPAGTELNTIVRSLGINAGNELVEDTLNNLNPSSFNAGEMYIDLKPGAIKNHIFTIEIEKSNHEVLTAASGEIIFQ
jgi:hypothetical protein